MKKLLVLVFFGSIFFVLPIAFANGPNPVFLGDAGDGTYTITMKKMEISEDQTTWVTLGEQTKAFNIASKDVGATVDSYISNSSIPIGTYNYLRFTLSRTIIIEGQGDYSGSTYYTSTQNGSFITGGNTFYFASTDEGGLESVSFKVPDDAEGGENETLTLTDTDMIITKDLSGNPIVINEDDTKGMVMSFNTESMIGFEYHDGEGKYYFYPMPPDSDYSEE